jgi:hypothetical protein
MEINNLLKIFRQKFLRNAKHAISARGSSVDQQNALAPIRRVGSCKEGDNRKDWQYLAIFLAQAYIMGVQPTRG